MSDKGSPTQTIKTRTAQVRAVQRKTKGKTTDTAQKANSSPKRRRGNGGGGGGGGGGVGGGLPDQIKTAARKGRRTTEVIHAHDGSPSTTLPNRCTVTSLYRQLWTPTWELCYRPPPPHPRPRLCPSLYGSSTMVKLKPTELHRYHLRAPSEGCSIVTVLSCMVMSPWTCRQLRESSAITTMQHSTALLPSVKTVALGMFCHAKYTHHTFTPII